MPAAVVIIWAASSLFFAVAVGFKFKSLNNSFIDGRLARFFLGFALSPFLLGALIAASSLFGALRSGLAPAGVVCAAALVLCLSAYFSRREREAVPAKPTRMAEAGWIGIGAAIALCFLAVGSMPFIARSGFPILGGDANQYLSEAIDLLRVGSIGNLGSILGTADGRLKGDIHSPVWAAYLAYGLAFTDAAPGYPHDIAARYSILAISLFYLAGAAAVSIVLSKRYWLAIFAVIVACSFSWEEYSYVINYHSRDALRLLAIMCLLASLLAWLRPAIGGQKPGWTVILIAVLIGAATSSSHALALTVTPVAVLAWAITALVGGARFAHVGVVVVSFGVGTILGAHALIITYFSTGALLGDNFFPQSVLRGTEYAAVVDAYNAGRVQAACEFGCLVQAAMSRGGQVTPVLGVLMALAVTIVTIVPQFRQRLVALVGPSRSLHLTFLALLAIGLFPPLLVLADTVGIKLSFLVAANLRYGMQWYVACAVLIAYVLVLCADLGRRLAWRRLFAVALVVPLAAGLFHFVAQARSRMTLEWGNVGTATLDALQKVGAELPAGSCRFATEVDQSSYYLADRAVHLYSQPLRSIFMASSPEQVEAEFRKRGICAVVAYSNFYIASMSDRFPLKALLDDRSRVQKLDAGYLQLFVIQQ